MMQTLAIGGPSREGAQSTDVLPVFDDILPTRARAQSDSAMARPKLPVVSSLKLWNSTGHISATEDTLLLQTRRGAVVNASTRIALPTGQVAAKPLTPGAPGNLTFSAGKLVLSLSDLRDWIIRTPSLAKAEIVEIEGYIERFGNFNHRFVLLKLDTDETPVWLRLERQRRYFVPGAIQRLLHSSFRCSEDIAQLSDNMRDLIGNATLISRNTSKSPRPTASALQHILRIICEELRNCRVWQADGSLFFYTLIQEHIAQPSPSSGRIILRQLSQRVMERIRLIRHTSTTTSVSSENPELNIPDDFALNADIKKFYENQSYGSGLIHAATRYRAQEWIGGHEFIIIHAKVASMDFFVRIDRVGEGGPLAVSSALSSSSDILATDTVKIAKTERQLLAHVRSCTKQVSTITFPDEGLVARRPTVHDVAEVLDAIGSISPRFNLYKENCRFVTSVVQEALVEMFAGTLEGPSSSWARAHAPNATKAIFRRLARA